MGSYRHYWSTHPLLNVQQVSSVMGRERFEKITQYFHLNDDEQGDRTTEGYDPMLKIRPVLDHVRSACLNVYAPSCQLSIDEGMIGFKGRVYFRQYLPSKPERYGIKFLIYFSKALTAVPPPGPIVKAGPWALPKSKQKKGESIMLQDGNLVATQWTDKRQVNIVSTNCSSGTATTSRRSRSGREDGVLTLPTDIARIIQWVVLVANGGINFLLQISIVNSFILMKKNSSGAKRRSAAQEQVYFRVDLCQSLLQRTGKRNSTTAEVPSVASYAPTCIPDSHKLTKLPGRHRVCYQCSQDKRKTGSGRTPETIFGCTTCNVRLCKGHCFANFHNF
ncbi:hypothetical protein RRG08_057822 [Elysia crispata]|uniref:PiggyBac transposable element-derived protein domain-containing protein n=1 Tax=Elysia crispata TaxID=231223 RepID=A0AAE1B0G3_9GAST|nr:hypothetical protein RRG08_057822 [Elysia crispata]